MHAFFDRDVYFKIACCDLWSEVLQALGVTHPYRLASASAKGALRPLARMSLDEAVRGAALERISTMGAQVPVLPEDWVRDALTSALFKKISAIHNIDSGEAILSVVVVNCPREKRLISGDKRFIESLRVHQPEEFSMLQPFLISFERCLLAVCEHFSFDEIRDRLWAARGCDQALKLSLGSDGQTDVTSFREALVSFSPL